MATCQRNFKRISRVLLSSEKSRTWADSVHVMIGPAQNRSRLIRAEFYCLGTSSTAMTSCLRNLKRYYLLLGSILADIAVLFQWSRINIGGFSSTCLGYWCTPGVSRQTRFTHPLGKHIYAM